MHKCVIDGDSARRTFIHHRVNEFTIIRENISNFRLALGEELQCQRNVTLSNEMNGIINRIDS